MASSPDVAPEPPPPGNHRSDEYWDDRILIKTPVRTREAILVIKQNMIIYACRPLTPTKVKDQ